jgi:hypothetical protein
MGILSISVLWIRWPCQLWENSWGDSNGRRLGFRITGRAALRFHIQVVVAQKERKKKKRERGVGYDLMSSDHKTSMRHRLTRWRATI